MSGPEQAATVTPGQAAHRRWHQVRFPDSTDEAIAKEWAILSNRATAAWEAAAIEAHKPGSERVAELVTEGNELREELAQVRKFADALERITTTWTRGMYCAWIDCQRGDVKAAAMCLSEGLDGYDGTRWNGTETGAEWWERTKAEEGLTDDPPAVVTAGTEHLAEKIRGLAIPDEL